MDTPEMPESAMNVLEEQSPGGGGTTRSQERRVARRKHVRLQAALFAVLFAGFVLLVAVFLAYQRSIAWVDHTNQVLRAVDLVLVNLTDAEAGQRGYLLSQERHYLAPYEAARERIPSALDAIATLTRDNPVQQDNLERLRPLVQSRLEGLQRTLQVMAAEGPAQAAAAVRDSQGTLMDDVRQRIAAMEREESRLLEQRSNRADSVQTVLVLLAAALAGAVVWTVRSGFRRLESDFEEERREGEALARSLDGNRLLLDEVNHRVKNSLQVVSMLLRTQALKHGDPAVRDQLLHACGRVDAVAQVHRRLYGQDRYDQVELGTLLHEIAESAAPPGCEREPALAVDAPAPIPVPIHQAVPVSLIVNELITNSHKHAFPDGRAGAIRLSLRETDGTLRVEVADDGVGLPDELPADFMSGRPRSFGLGMIHTLTRQLDGALSVERTAPGTRFVLTVPVGA